MCVLWAGRELTARKSYPHVLAVEQKGAAGVDQESQLM